MRAELRAALRASPRCLLFVRLVHYWSRPQHRGLRRDIRRPTSRWHVHPPSVRTATGPEGGRRHVPAVTTQGWPPSEHARPDRWPAHSTPLPLTRIVHLPAHRLLLCGLRPPPMPRHLPPPGAQRPPAAAARAAAATAIAAAVDPPHDVAGLMAQAHHQAPHPLRPCLARLRPGSPHRTTRRLPSSRRRRRRRTCAMVTRC